MSYDYLVFATGAETSYFGMENLRKNAIPMKTLNDAVEMRNILLQRMEEASIASANLKDKYLTVVIAGGGPHRCRSIGDVRGNEKCYFKRLS